MWGSVSDKCSKKSIPPHTCNTSQAASKGRSTFCVLLNVGATQVFIARHCLGKTTVGCSVLSWPVFGAQSNYKTGDTFPADQCSTTSFFINLGHKKTQFFKLSGGLTVFSI